MGHTYHQNYGHLIFHVRNIPIRTDDLVRFHAYIGGIAMQHAIGKPIVGGIEDHVHVLGNFPITRPASDLVRVLKSASSYWLKGVHGHYYGFSWQQGYGYFSVSASLHQSVAAYILNQRQHHAKMTATEEFERLIAKHSVE